MAEFKVPELGENISQGDVTRVLVQAGDTISRDQPVLELETDKATIEVQSSIAGVVKEVKVRAYDMMRITGGPKSLAQGAANTVQMTDAILAHVETAVAASAR